MELTLRALLLAATALVPLPALAQQDGASDAKKEAATAPELAPPAVDKPVAEKPAAPPKDYTIIRMGNEEIKNSDVLETWKGLFPGSQSPDFNTFDEKIRQNVLRGIVSEHLIYAEATKTGVDKDPDVKKRIAQVTKQVIMQSFMEEKAKDLVTDAQLKAAYAEKVAATKGKEEVKAKHILVPTEEDAKKIAADLKKGGDFDKIAKEKSTDKGSGANGGELGWFTKETMVPEFADAAFKMKKGEVSEPVKSEFGWHIIMLEDRRPVQAPSFDDMKEKLRNELAGKAVQEYVEGLLKKANVKYYDPSGKEKPFSTSLTPEGKAEEKK